MLFGDRWVFTGWNEGIVSVAGVMIVMVVVMP